MCIKYPIPEGVKISYGTAGFRADASIISSTVFRVGILAALRSLKTISVIGIMITASHNQISDNGVKIADPSGGMLTQEWEPFADLHGNAPDPQNLVNLISEFAKKENISFGGDYSAEVLLGRDTRPSGESLLEAARQGISSVVGAVATDMGILTTPQLHWMVRYRNMGKSSLETDYFKQLSNSFRCLMDYIPGEMTASEMDELIVDGANGVGGAKLEVVRNSGREGEGVLNHGVGADFVQKEKIVPSGFGQADVGKRCASLDGDADQFVYFHVLPGSNNKIELVDGDKILSLFALFIKQQLAVLSKEDGRQVHLGIVQTAYANGASTDYLKKLGLEVALTPTGVKYLHEKAYDYDIGIYFEANGHGTILFSASFLSWLETRNKELASTPEVELINQAVGDALSGVLLVEVILRHMGWSIQKWSELYQDLPSRQLKVKVMDRTAVTTANAEAEVVKPTGLQEAINCEVAKYTMGRSFVRPSGTEDVIRVYAEASTQEEADNLAKSVAQHVDRFLGFGSS
ncbi:hypothetical protein MKW98_023210 [Papaver atlanticum]|uniref:Phosphoacetylglucosamine mutase n=1 Tax=Papaver atlanticum TaxID=357466 RepID=A0AAD4T9H5_9MAGN|nr:hypothetical protein MKW98_023210 [Papaver atlanticum]